MKITMKKLFYLLLFVLLQRPQEGHLVLVGLEPTVTELAAGVDKLQ